MVYLLSYTNPLLLLLSTAIIVIDGRSYYGYQHNSLDEESGLLGYQPEDGPNVYEKRDPGKNLMWIGPRLGRRKRSEEENAIMPENRPKNGPTVVEFLQDSPWAFVALKGGKRRTVNFIPRLGRDSDEEYNAVDSAYAKSSSRSGNQLSGPFAGGNNFTPRLGRYVTLLNRERYGSTF